VNAALGLGARERRRVEASRGAVSILGAGRQSIVIRVANLAQGTTAEDVVVSRRIEVLSELKLMVVCIRSYAILERNPIPLDIITSRIGRSGSRESTRCERIDQ
jgi:hypothetical protein